MSLKDFPGQIVEVVFFSVREDDLMLQGIVKHLNAPELKSLMRVWSRLDIKPGEDADIEIMTHLETAHMILLLVSPDFVSSCCDGKEIERCMQRRLEGVCVIPIIVRYAMW